MAKQKYVRPTTASNTIMAGDSLLVGSCVTYQTMYVESMQQKAESIQGYDPFVVDTWDTQY